MCRSLEGETDFGYLGHTDYTSVIFASNLIKQKLIQEEMHLSDLLRVNKRSAFHFDDAIKQYRSLKDNA